MIISRGLAAVISLVVAIIIVGSALGYAYTGELSIAEKDNKIINSLKAEITSFNDTLQNDSKINAELMGTITSLESMLMVKNSTLEGYQTEINNLKNDSLSLNATIRNIELQLSTKNRTIDNLQTNISNLQSEINSLNSQMKTLSAEIQNFTTQINDLKSILSLNDSSEVLDNNTLNNSSVFKGYQADSNWILNFTYSGYIKIS
ncbi:MAG: hypothetical protein QXS21_06810, partial [Thermoproteota archaeon]